MADKETRLLHEYLHEVLVELKISKFGRRSLDTIKGSLSDKLMRAFGGGSVSSTGERSSSEQSSLETELTKWFEQMQKIGKKKISSSKVREIKNYAEQTYKKFLQNDDEDVAIVKTIRALDKKYASDV